MDEAQVSADSYEKRRAARAAGAGANSDSDDDAEGPLRNVPDANAQAVPRNNATEAVDAAQLPGEGPEAGKGKPKAPRPKLTYGHLTSQAGIPHVFGTFQEAFHEQRKGKGHETSDLGRLLDMYERWHLRLFPHCDFDTFLSRVAGLHGKPGGKVTTGASLKGDMCELRESVIQIALENVQLQDEDGNAIVAGADLQQDNAAAADPSALASQAHAAGAPAASAGAAPMALDGDVASQASPRHAHGAGAQPQAAAPAAQFDSDDEFDAVEGAAMSSYQAAPVAAPASARAAVAAQQVPARQDGDQDQWDADELMGLVNNDVSAAPPQAHGVGAEFEDEDMDELDGMLA